MIEQITDAARKHRDLDFAYCLWRFQMWAEGAGSYNNIDAAASVGRMTPFKPMSEQRWLQEMREGGCD